MAATAPASLTVLVTGASAGIGAAVARRFARDGSRVIITGRRRDKLAALHDELAQSAPCHVLCFDVSNRADVEKVRGPVRRRRRWGRAAPRDSPDAAPAPASPVSAAAAGDRVAAARLCQGQRPREQCGPGPGPGARVEGQPRRLGHHDRHQLQGPRAPRCRAAAPPRSGPPLTQPPPSPRCPPGSAWTRPDLRNARAVGRYGGAQRRPCYQHRLRRRLVAVQRRQRLRRHQGYDPPGRPVPHGSKLSAPALPTPQRGRAQQRSWSSSPTTCAPTSRASASASPTSSRASSARPSSPTCASSGTARRVRAAQVLRALRIRPC